MPNPTGQVPTIQAKGIEQTRQLMRAALRVGVRMKKAKEDGKITIAEYAAFTADAGIIIDAVRGVSDVPMELIDLQRDENAVLYSECVAILNEMGVTTRQEELIQRAFSFVQAGIDFLAFIVLAPPSAKPA